MNPHHDRSTHTHINQAPILQVQDLEISFKTQFGRVTPVDDVRFDLHRGETLGIVGESGCGKTITAFSILRLLPRNAIIGDSSRIFFEGKNVAELSKEQLHRIRGKKISMIFQEPMTSLNPVYTIGHQLAEVFKLHEGLTEKEAWARSLELLHMVRIPEPKKRIHDYPHLLSGGMRQRVMIAMALACKPLLLIADEPTTALDVTIQAQILELIDELRKKQHTTTIVITHDLGVVAEMCDRVIVMYAGQIVESAEILSLFDRPRHPYSQGLIHSIPRVEVPKHDQKRLHVIPGYVPHPSAFPKGCRFQPRCDQSMERCVTEVPSTYASEDGHYVKCWLYDTEGVTHE